MQELEQRQRQAATTNELISHPESRLVASVGGGAAAGRRPGDAEVLTVLGGKASCRRKFVLHLQLLDTQGKAVKPGAATGLSIVASVAFAHDHSPVLLPSFAGEAAAAPPPPASSAEPPLFTTFHGVEFPAHAHPTLLDSSGCASFKLSISLLSSKFDNRLFCICFTPQELCSCAPCFSSPIRSISRKRNPVRSLDLAGHVKPGRSTELTALAAPFTALPQSCKQMRVFAASQLCTEELASFCAPNCPSRTEHTALDAAAPPAQNCCEGIRAYAPTDVYRNSQKRTPGPQEMISWGVASPCNSETVSAETISSSDESIDQGLPTFLQKDQIATPPLRLQLDDAIQRLASAPSLQAASRRMYNEPGKIIRPVARVGVGRLPFLRADDHSPELLLQQPLMSRSSSLAEMVNGSTARVLQQRFGSRCMQSMEAMMESFTLNRKGINGTAALDQGLQYAGDDEDEEEERAIRYLEISLAEMSREIQRRKQEMAALRLKRRRVAMHEQDPYIHPGSYIISNTQY